MTTHPRWSTRLHLMPPTGWLNDPNGLCQFHGLYHVFFQYRPGDARGTGDTGWGHYTSPDLIHWTFAGMPLEPDQDYDRDGVYSGSALIDDDTMRLYYTGNVKHPGDYDYTYAGRGANVVLVESADGMTFGEKEPLLGNADYPESCTCHVRDPKVWKDGADYYMVLGARFRGSDSSPDWGGVLLYHSTDGLRWNYRNTLTTPDAFGYMWECPDTFFAGGTQLLSISPQGLKRENHRFQNVYQSGYFTVAGEITDTYTVSDFREWDMGFDFYAPQTFLDEQGRRILIGWMGLPDIEGEYENPTVQDGWQHVLTIPREVWVNDAGAVCQRPVAELETLRSTEYRMKDHDTITVDAPFELLVCGNICDDGDNGNNHSSDITITLYDSLQICCSPTQGEYSITFLPSPHSGKDTPHESTHGAAPGYGRTTRRARIPATVTQTQIRILCDTSAIEVFFGEGETVMSTRIYPDPDAPATVTIMGGTGYLWEMDGLEVR